MTNTLQWLNLRRLGFIAVFLSLLTLLQLSDPDYFWHLRTGQYLFEQRTLPVGDIFSYTQAGQPWILHEWLFEILLYCIHAMLGPFGVKLITSLLATATLVTVYTTANRILDRPYAAFFLTLLFFIPAYMGVSPRPQIATLLLFALFLRVLTEFKYSHTTRTLWLMPPLMMVWTNAHGGYVTGLALLLLFTACEWLIYLIRPHRDAAQNHRLVTLLLVTVTTILASLVNPYFIEHWLYPFKVLGMEAAKSYVSEWHSPDFHSFPFQVYLVLVFVTMTAAMYRRMRPDITELAVMLFFVTAGFVSSRHIPLAVIALIPFAAVTTAQLPFTQLLSSEGIGRLSEHYRRFARSGSDLGRTEFILNWLLLALIALGLLLYYPVFHAADIEKVNKIVPVKATEFIIQAGINGRMLNTYHYGGYLIQWLYPNQKVFIDGRADMYGDKFLQEYITISSGGAEWEEKFEKYKIDYVVSAHDAPLVQLLTMRGDFKLVYKDEVNSVLLKDDPKFAQIIARYGK